MKLRFQKEEFTKAIMENSNIIGAIRALGLPEKRSSYDVVYRYILIHSVNASHLKPHTRADKTKKRSLKISNEEIFNATAGYDRTFVRRMIINEQLLPYVCQRCKITEWQGEKITLELDHINGIPTDHRLENLRFLCPNCHSLTDTFNGKNRKTTRDPALIICKCGKKKKYTSPRCRTCASRSRSKVNWPSDEDLVNLINNSNQNQVAKSLGINHKAVSKRLITRNLKHLIITPKGSKVC